MENLNIQNNNQSQQSSQMENSMSFNELLVQYFNVHVSETGDGRFTSFKKHMDDLMKNHIKPLSVRAGKSASDGSWRSELESKFGGRGKKWYFVSIDEISPTLENLSQTEDISQYKAFIEEQEKAWIRFKGPRINNGVQSAAFEVRINGSKLDHPKQLHYIAIDQLDEIITPFEAGSTPFSLKLENIQSPEDESADETEETISVDDASQSEETVEENTTEEVATENEEISAPTSNDPAEWEAYLDQLELSADLQEEIIEDVDHEEDNDDSLFGSF